MQLSNIDLDHARSRLAHCVAYCVHFMLAEANMTVDELKERISKFPDGGRKTTPAQIDAMLSATDSHTVTCSAMADVAFALQFEWNFKIVRVTEVPEEVPAAETTE